MKFILKTCVYAKNCLQTDEKTYETSISQVRKGLTGNSDFDSHIVDVMVKMHQDLSCIGYNGCFTARNQRTPKGRRNIEYGFRLEPV